MLISQLPHLHFVDLHAVLLLKILINLPLNEQPVRAADLPVEALHLNFVLPTLKASGKERGELLRRMMRLLAIHKMNEVQVGAWIVRETENWVAAKTSPPARKEC